MRLPPQSSLLLLCESRPFLLLSVLTVVLTHPCACLLAAGREAIVLQGLSKKALSPWRARQHRGSPARPGARAARGLAVREAWRVLRAAPRNERGLTPGGVRAPRPASRPWQSARGSARGARARVEARLLSSRGARETRPECARPGPVAREAQRVVRAGLGPVVRASVEARLLGPKRSPRASRPAAPPRSARGSTPARGPALSARQCRGAPT
jgi:hypothetical protein